MHRITEAPPVSRNEQLVAISKAMGNHQGGLLDKN
jgi:hypothetical protein